MHINQTVELAALAAAQGPVVITAGESLSETALADYWAMSKCRFDRWSRGFKMYSPKQGATRTNVVGDAAAVLGLLEEVFVGEILTRVWTAVLAAYDRRRGADDAEVVGRSIWLAHMESRNRALKLVMRSEQITLEQTVAVNRLRRRAERWTDMLIGYLLGVEDVSEFAFEPRRAREFAEDLRYRGRLGGGGTAWRLVLTSLRWAFHQPLWSESHNGDLNQRIAASIAGSFPPGVFDATGLFRSLWLTRLETAATDTQVMLAELFAAEREPTAPRESVEPDAAAGVRPRPRFLQ